MFTCRIQNKKAEKLMLLLCAVNVQKNKWFSGLWRTISVRVLMLLAIGCQFLGWEATGSTVTTVVCVYTHWIV